MSWHWQTDQGAYPQQQPPSNNMAPQPNSLPLQQHSAARPPLPPPFHGFNGCYPQMAPPSLPPPPPPANLLHFHSAMYQMQAQRAWPPPLPHQHHHPQPPYPSTQPAATSPAYSSHQLLPSTGRGNAQGRWPLDEGRRTRQNPHQHQHQRGAPQRGAHQNRQMSPGNGNKNQRKRHTEKPQRDCTARDMEDSQKILKRLGQSLPGSSPDDVTRWVAERKRNWPSRANVERKLAEQARRKQLGELKADEGRGQRLKRHSKRKEGRHQPKANAEVGPKETQVDALATIAQVYKSSEEEEEGEVVEERKVVMDENGNGGEAIESSEKSLNAGLSVNEKGVRKPKKRRSRRRTGKGKVKKGANPPIQSTQQSSLLHKLLRKEIRYEQSILLQAFRHLLHSD